MPPSCITCDARQLMNLPDEPYDRAHNIRFGFVQDFL